MAPYMQLYIHCVWATWDRLPLLTPAVQPRVYGAIRAKCENLGCTVIALGGIDDHVHLLARIVPTISPARLIGEVKGASSHLVTHVVQPDGFFKWQGSYGVFTVSKRSVPQVKEYVMNQAMHHAHATLIKELEYCSDDE